MEPETVTFVPNEPELGLREMDGLTDMLVVWLKLVRLDVVKEVEELVDDVVFDEVV
ncbi:MAG TPA: hypothetical protein VEG61_02925 [Candidatus Dormibacteraeota bacterium]|nr:hypothetical protein [Candidatus Dormibacteraeota bacterium]